jgi:hypothetical protein
LGRFLTVFPFDAEFRLVFNEVHQFKHLLAVKLAMVIAS